MTSSPTFFDDLARLSQILEEHERAPTALAELIQLLGDRDVRREFFGLLSGEDWLEPLQAHGFFSAPPEPHTTPEGGVHHPPWPAGGYLVRMAPRAPDTVALILTEVPVSNVLVVGNILDAANGMPPESARSLVGKIGDAAREGTLWIHFKDASDLCVRLAEGDQPDAALDLAHDLFAPREGEREEEVKRRDVYWYEDGLQNVVPAIARERPSELVQAMCGWLEALIEHSEYVTTGSADDGSYWWRPAVEEHEQNHDSRLAGKLVGSTRWACEYAIHDNQLTLDETLTILSQFEYVIFERLRVHLINEFADLAPDRARNLMMNRDLFDDFRLKHEYAMLVGRRLDLLSSQETAQWFAWVDAGPDLSDFDERLRARTGKDPTDQDRAGRRQYWQFEKLHLVRRFLTDDRLSAYEGMLAEHGEPELADLNARISSGWGGSPSPFSVEQLSELPLVDLLRQVTNWEPDRTDLRGPDVEGLAATFGDVVGRQATAFSSQASELVQQPPIYVRAFLTQMVAAAKAEEAIDVPAVLQLCRWVVDRSSTEAAAAPTADVDLVDRDWRWTRDEVARLILAVVQARTDGRPTHSIELRGPIWDLVTTLSRGPAVSSLLSEERKRDPRTHDYLTEAINSPRGRAIESALEYARWVAAHLTASAPADQRVPGGFDAMPEVPLLLEEQLSPENQTPLSHAILGSRVGLLYWIDKDWLAHNASKLFDLRDHTDPRTLSGWAAWNAFLVWVRPRFEYYRLFAQQFELAISHSGLADSTERSREDPMARLGEHLMVLYGRGDLDLEGEGSPIERFLSTASPGNRRHAIEFVGRVLTTETDLPQEFVDRYQALWERYWPSPGKRDALEGPDAYTFGLWCTSGRFPPEWALERLTEFASVVPVPQPDHQVVEYLAHSAPTDPAAAVAILDGMVRNDREGWRVGMWIDSARGILTMGLAASTPTHEQATALIDYLGRRGFTTLGELITPPATQS